MLGKVLAISTLCAFVLLSAFMQSTTPSSMHPLGILFVFFLIYLLVLGVLTFFMYAFCRVLIKIRKTASKEQVPFKRLYVYASVLALAPVMILAIASIGRLGVYEFLLVVAFEVIACFYVAKQR